MQLTVRDVSRYLNVSESTVTRWIKQRGLPSQHVGGQFRFNRAEVLEWATAQQIKVSVEMFEHLETDDEPVATLASTLEAGGIYYNVRADDKRQALHALVELLPLPEGVDREEILRLFLAREALASTAVGGGVALPHVRSPIVLHVTKPMVTACFLEKPIDFGALDGNPVYALFSLICPTMHSHLQTLSRLSYALRDPGFREVVLRRAPREELLREAARVESTVAAPAGPGRKVSD
jgi:PTS system nitrogen regulatory IIA component